MAALVITMLLALPPPARAFLAEDEIAALQREFALRPVGLRIAGWAEKFTGTPYDPDPDGEYVTSRRIIADERVDCMYLVFRSVELSFGRDPEHSVQIALDKRFIHGGVMDGGTVANYEDRFRYGEDMLDSGKWGREITGSLGLTTLVKGSRGREKVAVLSGIEAASSLNLLKSGDIVFFVKYPDRRTSDEIVGHMGIIKEESGTVYLIHAAGEKTKGGLVKKVLFSDYLKTMPFAGIRVSRYETNGP